MSIAGQRVVLHVSPHPDDEAVGAPGALVRLRSDGWRVLNLAIGLGRQEQHERRRQELLASTDVSGFELRFVEPPAAISGDDDLLAAESALVAQLVDRIIEIDPALVVGPSAFDPHHGHAVVGRAIVAAFEATDFEAPLWLWNIWGLSEPANLLVELGGEEVSTAERMLECHAGEVQRAGLTRLLSTRSRFHAAVGVERVLGFGSVAPRPVPLEGHLLSEVRRRDGAWVAASPRLVRLDRALDPATYWMAGPVQTR